jgi:hypothetical protein
MKFFMGLRRHGSGVALLAFGTAGACTVDVPEPKTYAQSAIERKLAACPEAMSSDPVASSCLVGTYNGTTLANEACTLTLGQNASYQYSSPAIEISRAMPTATFSFSHVDLDGFNLLNWRVREPASINATTYDLAFEASFGAMMSDDEAKIEIDLTERGGMSRSSTCIVRLRG